MFSPDISQPINRIQPTVYEEVHVDLAIDMLTTMFDGNDGEYNECQLGQKFILNQANENCILKC